MVKRRYMNTKTTARSSAAKLIFISYETSIICCLFSPIIWKTVNNVPYLTDFRGFQDKSPSAFPHTQSFSQLCIFLYLSLSWYAILRWKNQSCVRISAQDAGAPLWAYTAGTRCFIPSWMLTTLRFPLHRVYPASRAGASKCLVHSQSRGKQS